MWVFVDFLGQQNAVKCFFFNAAVGLEVAFVSLRTHTTRNSILGILSGKDFQMIFVDTPGIHHSQNKLDKFMMKNVRSAIAGADVVLYLFDGSKPMEEEEKQYIQMLEQKCENLILVQTKADKKQVLTYPNAIQISSQTGENVQKLLDQILLLLPERDFVFDEDLYTDRSIKFLISEKIRGVLLEVLDKEVPHGIAVVITNFVEDENLVKIDAEIVCEREQHKGIIIGKGGKTLKLVGQKAREYAEELLGQKCLLKLFVKVDENWREKNISAYGY